MRRRHRQGFTMIELLVAMAITAMITSTMMSALWFTIRARQEVEALSEPLRDGPRILAIIKRDLQAMVCYNVKDYKLLLGSSKSMGGQDGDRIDFLAMTENLSPFQFDSRPIRADWCEVGYMVRVNPDNPDFLELFRREDLFSDNYPFEGGGFQPLSKRVRRFNITYFATLGFEAEPLEEWDTSTEGTLPRRIRIDLEIEREAGLARQVETEDYEDRIIKYRLEHVFPKWREESLLTGNLLAPMIPPGPPEVQEEGATGAEEGGGPGGPGGPAGGRMALGKNGNPDMGGRGMKGPDARTKGTVGGRPGSGGTSKGNSGRGSQQFPIPGGGSGQGNSMSLDQFMKMFGGGASTGGMGSLFGGRK